MKVKQIAVLLAVLALALPLAAQMGFGSQVPTLSGVFRPVVGTGASYETTEDGKKKTWDFLVLGKEDIAGKTGYWVEMSVSDTRQNGDVLIKVLENVEGNTINYSKWVIQIPGQAPMEMSPEMMSMAAGRRGMQTQSTDFREKAELVGSESVTVPAGTFSCEHYRMKDGSGEAWISDKVSPWSVVKMQDQQRTTVLAKVITDAKDRITGTPVKFDPMQMMRNRQGQ